MGEEVKITTETGSVYEFREGKYAKNGGPPTTLRLIRQGERTNTRTLQELFQDINKWGDITQSQAFEVGKNLYIAGNRWNDWWVTTRITEVENTLEPGEDYGLESVI